MNEINIILNGKNIKGNAGETILSLAKRNGIEIPTLCNDDRLEPFSSCYVCVVEIEGQRTLQPACSTKIAEGMKINTSNERVLKARKTALDLLLSNHYADCLGPCKQTCPAGVDVQGYISYIEKKMYHEAIAVIKETNPLPAICGRVCVRPCEVACRRNLLNEGAAVGIDYLKRFAADKDLESPNKYKPTIKPDTNKKVAVIGAGPGGLSAAFFLRKEGHSVDIFEAAPKAGGWLRYGIPEYRLPNDILQKEVDNITEMGVTITYNQKLGENLSYKTINEKYDAVILAIGSQKGTSIGCEGDDAENVLSGIDFLKTMEITGKRYDFSGKTVAVIGGGNTAMDCCRSSIRCGAKKVYVIYRRTEKEMPANPIEIHESKLEGVEYMFLTAPVKVNKDASGKIKSLTCIKMELGEPDASGRRRPVTVPNSEFDIEMDYAIAAIGQKTVVNFLEDINKNTDKGTLNVTKWGDVEADEKTLQTGIKNVFACGDGVTGPATLIQAVAQARVASLSCHQYLMGLPIQPEKKEFISKRDNFKAQIADDYIGKYQKKLRHEMPTLEPNKRNNFQEVELGYENEEVAVAEAQRCLECGCVAYYDCDLKKYATEYNAEQKRFEGQFKESPVDFSHRFIEIDNNKCILCSRCIRICREVVGASALGLVNRGFDTYVAPSMGGSLEDTNCEWCGLCLSACPTGALSENVIFKPGPVKLDSAPTICNYCSIGCELDIMHKNGFAMKVEGLKGLVNTDGNICRFGKFGYNYINDHNRITKPLKKVNGQFVETSFEEAFKIITDKIKSVNPDENAFYAGARLSNEELYSIQKLARAGVKTNNITSFHYLNRGDGYFLHQKKQVPFEQISMAGKIYLLGSEINKDNAVVSFMVNNTRYLKNIPVTSITNKENSAIKHKVDKEIKVESYYYFAKAANYYLLKNGWENQLFIKDHIANFEEYKKQLLAESFEDLLNKAGICCKKCFEEFVQEFNQENHAVLIYSEKEVTAKTATELFNLAILTGKLGKTASGIIALKEKNNAQGLGDMGICAKIGIGGIAIDNADLKKQLSKVWGIKELPSVVNQNQYELLENGKIKNMFIFGEDPVGCAKDKAKVLAWMKKANFKVVQDYFMTETAKESDIILPASLPTETGGTFTNTQKVIQHFEAVLPQKVSMNNLTQIGHLLHAFDVENSFAPGDVLQEIIELLPKADNNENMKLITTTGDSIPALFNYGCDSLVAWFHDKYERI